MALTLILTLTRTLTHMHMLGGFALAVNAQGSSSLPGVAAALGSLLALNGVQHCSRACSVRGLHDVQVQRRPADVTNTSPSHTHAGCSCVCVHRAHYSPLSHRVRSASSY